MLIVNQIFEDSPLVRDERAKGEHIAVSPDDNGVIRRLREEADGFVPEKHGGQRLECWLLLESGEALWLLQKEGLIRAITEKADVIATTMDDLTAKTLLVRLPGQDNHSMPLDSTPIGLNSEQTVHLVIFGTSPQAEVLAVNTALTAHFPNYCRDNRLRTRITVVGYPVTAFRSRMLQRYRHLFEHCYHRTLDLEESNPQCILHRPMYEKSRKDFVDIEWEFVNGSTGNDAVRQKLAEWACAERQQLTVAMCYEDEGENVTTAFSLPEEVYTHEVPVLCHTREESLIKNMASDHCRKVVPYSENICRLATLRTLKQMAMRVNYVYNHCFALAPDDPITAPAVIDEQQMKSQWTSLGSFTKQCSCLFNAMTLGTKMHSVGIGNVDWKDYYALSKEEIEMLAEVEHNRWSVEELLLGYRPVSDEEQRAVEADINVKKKLREQKVHYDLRSYDDLRVDATGKNVNVYDKALVQGIPLIVKTCTTS